MVCQRAGEQAVADWAMVERKWDTERAMRTARSLASRGPRPPEAAQQSSPLTPRRDEMLRRRSGAAPSREHR